MRQVCAENPSSGQNGVCARGIRSDYTPTRSSVEQALQLLIRGICEPAAPENRNGTTDLNLG
jgi:hypothetical protein